MSTQPDKCSPMTDDASRNAYRKTENIRRPADKKSLPGGLLQKCIKKCVKLYLYLLKCKILAQTGLFLLTYIPCSNKIKIIKKIGCFEQMTACTTMKSAYPSRSDRGESGRNAFNGSLFERYALAAYLFVFIIAVACVFAVSAAVGVLVSILAAVLAVLIIKKETPASE